jgi:hypothetical protein
MICWAYLISALLLGQLFLPGVAIAEKEQAISRSAGFETPATASLAEKDREVVELLELLELMELRRDMQILATLEGEKKK